MWLRHILVKEVDLLMLHAGVFISKTAERNETEYAANKDKKNYLWHVEENVVRPAKSLMQILGSQVQLR